MQIRCKLQTDHIKMQGASRSSSSETTIHNRVRVERRGLLVLDGHFSNALFLDDRVEVNFARRRTVQTRTGTEAFAERGWDEEVVRLALESLRGRIIAQSVTGTR